MTDEGPVSEMVIDRLGLPVRPDGDADFGSISQFPCRDARAAADLAKPKRKRSAGKPTPTKDDAA